MEIVRVPVEIAKVAKQVGVRRTVACLFWFTASDAATRAADVLEESAWKLSVFGSKAYVRARALDVME